MGWGKCAEMAQGAGPHPGPDHGVFGRGDFEGWDLKNEKLGILE